MTKNQIIAKMASLNLPQGSYVVFGSAPMAVAGLREAKEETWDANNAAEDQPSVWHILNLAGVSAFQSSNWIGRNK